MAIGFVGTGRMGANMARRLADLGYAIGAVYDPQTSVAASLALELNCLAATTLPEGLGLGTSLGLDRQVLKEVFSQTGANSRVLETDGDDMILRDHDCYFSAAHAAKDSGIANALARSAGMSAPLSRSTETQYRKMINLGLGGLDKSGIAELTFPNRSRNGIPK